MKPDSLIFDMDGTLWDNVHTYAIAWNKAMMLKGYKDVNITREELMKHMGKEISEITRDILANDDTTDVETLFQEVEHQYHLLVPKMSPIIYDGVCEGLQRLSNKYRLFMLSNCETNGILNFMNYTNTRALFTGYMEHGQNRQSKRYNMKLLSDKYHLKNPMYVGDTDSDSREATQAGIPFIFVTYGFGTTDKYEMKFDSFQTMTDYFMNL